MKMQKKDWNGFQVKPPPLRRKAGIATGTRFAEPAEPRPVCKGQLTKWMSRRRRAPAGGNECKKSVPQRQALGKSLPQRKAERSCPVVTCADSAKYYKVSTRTIEKASAVVVHSAHDLAKQSASELTSELLVVWLGIIAHGKTVHARVEKAATRFNAAARTDAASVAFSSDFAKKHPRILNEFKKVAESGGSSWCIADASSKLHSAAMATPVSNLGEFRHFLLTQVRKPRIAGVEWSLESDAKKPRWMSRYGTQLPQRTVAK
jgi:hypothetical protein